MQGIKKKTYYPQHLNPYVEAPYQGMLM